MSHTPSSLRTQTSRRGHVSNKSLPGRPYHASIFPSNSPLFEYAADINRKRETAPVIISATQSQQRDRRSEDDFGVVARPFPTLSPPSSSSSSSTIRSTRPSSSPNITHEVVPFQAQQRHYLSNTSKPLPPPLPKPRDDKPLPQPIGSSNISSSNSPLVKPTWTMPAVFDPRDYSIEPMSYWSDDSDDSDAEEEKKRHKRGSSKLTGIWRRSRNSKSMKQPPSTTNTTIVASNPQFLDELTMNLARMQ